MKLASMLPFRTALCILGLLVASTTAAAPLTVEYCSTQNTGASNGALYYSYQSLGWCSTHCGGDGYAFGIVQGLDCWCSNYIPAQQGSIASCNTKCPGYPYEYCGNPSENLFAYIPLAKAPLGTAGGGGSKPTNSPPNTPNTPSSSSQPPTTSSTVQTRITVISGSKVTQTVTRTPMGAAPGSNSGNGGPKKETLSDGAIAGVAIGVVGGISGAAFVSFLFYRRKMTSDTETGGSVRNSSRSPKRKGSVLSRTGLLGGARPHSMAEINAEDPYYPDAVAQRTSTRHSMMLGTGASSDSAAPGSPLGSSGDDAAADNRSSKPLVYDQRLNPSALFAHHDNGSWISMQDQHDYSRSLGVANPEFSRTYSFDSR